MSNKEKYKREAKDASKRKLRECNNIIKNFRNKFTLCIYTYFLIILYLVKSKENRNLISKYSIINITINTPGKHKIIGSRECTGTQYIIPNKIFINGIENETIASEYDLSEEINNISLYWDKEINSTACLFYKCLNITEIDLSDFNSSELLFIHGMFWHCRALTTINFL